MEVVTARKGGKRRKYSDKDRAEALALLTANGGNLLRTATDLDMPLATLEGWAKASVTHPDVTELKKVKIEALEDLFEQAARKYIARALADDAVAKSSGKDAMITAATATDKMRLLRGESTQNVATGPDNVLATFLAHLATTIGDVKTLASEVRNAQMLEQYGATKEMREKFAEAVEKGEVKLLTP